MWTETVHEIYNLDYLSFSLLLITVHPVSPCSDPGGGGEIHKNQLFKKIIDTFLSGFHKNVITIRLISQKSDNLSMGHPGFNLKWIFIFIFPIANIYIFLYLAHKIVILEHILICSWDILNFGDSVSLWWVT